MGPGGHRFVEVALVSTIVSIATAALVTRCTAKLAPPPSLTSATEESQTPPAPPAIATRPAEVPARAVPPPPRADEGATERDAFEIADAAVTESVAVNRRAQPEVDASGPPEQDAAAMTELAVDAGAPPPAPRGPTFAAGAGRFLSEPPIWGSTSFVSNPEAGAGEFTAPPSWAASSFVSNPEAGAGEFTTERNLPAEAFTGLPIWFQFQRP